MREKEREHRRLLAEGLKQKADSLNEIIKDLKMDRKRLEDDKKEQEKQFEVNRFLHWYFCIIQSK